MSCCSGKTLPATTQDACSIAIATGCAPSMTTSREQRRWPWVLCWPPSTLPARQLTEQRIAIVGAGSAGIGIASLLLTAMKDAGLSESEARRRFYAVDKDGLLIEGMTGIRDSQQPFVQERSAVAGWTLEHARCMARSACSTW